MNIKRIWMMAPIIVLLLAMLVPLGTPVSAIQWSGTTDSGNNGTSTGGTFADYKYTTTNILDQAVVGYRFSVVSKSGNNAGRVKDGTSVKDVYMSSERYCSDALKAFRSATPRPKSVIRQDYKDYYNSYTQYSTSTSNVVLDKKKSGYSGSYLTTFPNLPSQPGGGNGQPTIGEWCQTGNNLDTLLKGAKIYEAGTGGLAKGTDVVLVEPLFFLKIDGKTVVLTATEIALYEYSLYMTSGSGVDIYGKKSGAAGTTVGSIIKHSNHDYSKMLREEGTANLSTTDFWYPAANIDSLVGSTFGYDSGTYNITSTYTVPSGTYNILSHIYIITRGYGVGVAWDGSTTPPTNKEAYVLSVNCDINHTENSMFPNLTNTSGTVGYASYVQIPEGSGVKTIANAGKDSYGYDAIFESGNYENGVYKPGPKDGKFVIKIKQTNGTDVYFYDPVYNTVTLCPNNNVMSVTQAHAFSTSFTVPYYTIRFDANAGGDTVTNMPAQNYSFDGEDVWGYIIRWSNNESLKRTATISHPTRSGYTFKGWSTNKNATSGTTSTTLTITSADATADGDKYNGIVYYAIWEPNPYTVTVNCKINGSSANFPNIKDTSNSTGGYAAYIQHNGSTTKAETKTSFSKDIACGSEYIIKVKDSYQSSRLFYLNSSGGVTSSETTLTMGSADKSYTVNYYTIKFNDNVSDGSVSGMPTASDNTIYGYKLKGPNREITGLSEPTRTGYTFLGWSTNKDATSSANGLQGKNSVEVSDASATADGDATNGIVVYAIWRPNTYTIFVRSSVNGDGGFANIPASNTGTGVYSAYIQVDGVTKAHPANDTVAYFTYTMPYGSQYVLKIKDDKNHVVSETTHTVTGDMMHGIDYCTIRFNANAGSDAVSDMPATNYTQSNYGSVYGYKVAESGSKSVSLSTTPKRTGCAFKGWSLTSDGATIGTTSLTLEDADATLNGVEDGIVLYAIWEEFATIQVNCYINNTGADFPNIKHNGVEGFASWLVINNEVAISSGDSAAGDWYAYSTSAGNKYAVCAKVRDDGIPYYLTSRGTWSSNSQNTGTTSTGSLHNYDIDYYTIRFDPNAGSDTVSGMPTQSYSFDGKNVWGYKLVGLNRTVNVGATPERTGYTFKGWSLDGSSAQIVGTNSFTATDSLAEFNGQEDGLVLYAVWEPNTYTVTVDCEINGSPANFPNIPNSTGVSGFASYIQDEAQKTTHAKAGTGNSSYSWEGAFDSTYVVKAKDAQTDRVFFVNSSDRIVSDIDVLKVGIVNEYTVGYYTIRFNDNVSDGSVSGMPTASDNTIYGYKLIGSTNKTMSGLSQPTRAGYTFLGWSTNKDATSSANGLQGKSSVEVSDASATADGDATNGIVVYAIWKPNTYTVTVNCKINGSSGTNIYFPDIKNSSGLSGYASYIQDIAQKETLGKAGDGSGGVYTVHLPYGTEFVVKAKDTQTRIFYVDANGNITDSTHALTVSTNHRFTISYYTIRFDPNAGNDTVNGMPTGNYETVWGYKLVGTDRAISGLSQPTRAGYTFLGWALTRDGATKGTTSLALTDAYATVDGIEDGIVLYAIWEEETPPSDPTFVVTWVDDDGSLLEQDNGVPYGDTPSYDGETPTKDSDDRYDYSFSGWTPEITPVTGDITYTATYTKTPRTYTVTWKNYNGTVLETDTKVPYGAIPSYDKGSNPTRPSVAQYTYTFIGWTPEIVPVTQDAVYTATFKEVLRTYTVTWLNYDGTVLEVDTEVPYGTMPSYDGETPVKPDDETYTYMFDGWTPTPRAVTKNATYTAVYQPYHRVYKVTWVDDDGTILEEDTYNYGGIPVFNKSTPYKEPTAQYTYTFAGWTPEVVPVTEDAIYTATYTPTLRTYTVTWVDEDGTVLEVDSNVPYGTTPSFDGDTPTKMATQQYTYTFDGWTPEVVPVTKNATYTATYKPSIRKYIIRVRVRVDAGSALPYDGGVYVTINGERQTLTSPNFGASIEYGASFAIYTTDYEGAPYETYYSGTVTGNKTHYVDYYTLTLTGDEGISKLETYNVDGNAVISGPILKGTKVSPLATVKPTHIFDEWTYITGTSSPFSAPEGNTSSEPMKLYWPDITVNAITEIMAHSLTHRIVFDKNDPNATGAMDDQYIRPGTGGTLNENEFVNEGRFFIGWNTKPDGSGDYYSDGDYFVAPAGKGGTTTFYAQWGIRVIYNANTGKTSDGGYSIDANGFVRRDGIIVEDIFDMKSSKTIKAYGDFSLYKDGTSCIGWVYDLSDIDGSKVPVAVYTLSDLESYADENGTVTLYAVWSVRTHKIDFNTNPANDLYGKVVYSNTSVNYITGVPHSSEIAQSGRTITITASQSAVVTVYYTNGTSKNVTLAKGATLVFTASPNTNTVQYTYGFASWSGAPLVVINDVTATATFTRTLNTFKATFIVEPPDYGSVSKSSVTNIPYGSTVTYKDNTVTITGPSGSGFTKTIVTATPTASTGGTSYSFTGWDGPASVVRNVEIIAFFSQSNKMDIAIVGNDIIGNPKAGSTFTASANLVNLSNQHVGYYDGMLVVLDVLDASGNVVAHYEKDTIPVPRLGSNNATTSSMFISTSQDVDRNGTLYTAVKYDNTNFVYFVIDIGLAKGNYKLRWSLDFSNCAFEEMGGSNNTDIVNVAVGAKTTASNPNRPDFSTDIPSSFKNKDHGESQTSNSFSWYELDYYQTDTEAFHTKRYTNGLDVVMVFTPENEAGLKDKDINILGLPDYTTRAGYGFSLHAPHSGLGLSINGFSNIRSSMVIGGAYTYGTPEALMTYPEFDYSKNVGKSTTLMVAQSNTGTNYRAFSLAFPEYKDYQSNDVNDRFAHYIPMWFPDGEYTPVTYFSGAWSPLGEMTATVVQGDERVTSGLTGSLNVDASEIMMSRRHIYSTVLKIFGSLYDDIYITG